MEKENTKENSRKHLCGEEKHVSEEKWDLSGEEARFTALKTYQEWEEGFALSYLRKRFHPIEGQPVAYERWFDEAAKVILVPSELDADCLDAERIPELIKVLSQVANPELVEGLINAVDDLSTLAELGKEVGLCETDVPWLVTLTVAAVAIAAKKQAAAALCGAECPYCHGLTCLFSGECKLAAGHKGAHQCSKKHRWR